MRSALTVVLLAVLALYAAAGWALLTTSPDTPAVTIPATKEQPGA